MKVLFGFYLLLLFSCFKVQGFLEVEAAENELSEITSHDKAVSAYDFKVRIYNYLSASCYYLNSTWLCQNSSSGTTPHNTNTEQTTTPLDLIADTKRQLNDGCMTFAFSEDNGDFYYQDNYVDVNGSGTTLQQYCDEPENNCCHSNGYEGFFGFEEYYDDQACGDWSKNPTVHYTVCPNSCVGRDACKNVANMAGDDSSITFESGSCSDRESCLRMAARTTKKLDLVVGENSCTSEKSCHYMAFAATNLEKLIVGSSSCTQPDSCNSAARSAQSLKQLFIEDDQCKSNGCFSCGADSTFSETLQLTEDCCSVVSGEGYYDWFDTACQYSEPSSIPSSSNQPSTLPSSIPSNQPSR